MRVIAQQKPASSRAAATAMIVRRHDQAERIAAAFAVADPRLEFAQTER